MVIPHIFVEVSMTIRDVLKHGIQILKNADIEAPASDAGVILCFVLNRDKTFLYAHDEYILEDDECEMYLSLMERRAKGMPVQYITGHQEFMSLDFHVAQDVLIPRHDTEILVETVIAYAKKLDRKDIKILDIGTGSGCIAVSLSYYIDGCHVTAADVSEKALEIACKNAIRNGVERKLKFLNSNLFENINSGAKFDIIVSNPPYIPAEQIKGLQREVKEFEPIAALDGGADGLGFYRLIIDRAPSFQNSGGILAFEVGYNQSEDVGRLISNSYYGIEIINDLSKTGRVVMGRLK